MKTFLLTFLSISMLHAVSAQRNVDLEVNLLSPVGGTEIHPMETFGLDIELTNLGSEALLASDSLAVYLIMNGDTIPQMDGNYWTHTDIALTNQQTYTIHKMMAFDNSLLGAHVDFCVFVRPFNQVNPLNDNVMTNNKSCAEVDVVEEVNDLTEINSESVIIYPNPVQNTLFLTGEHVNNVSITDNTGKIVVEKPADFYKIDCSGLKNGIYFVRISTDKGESIQKIAIEK